jgi:hypothetical protein
MPWPALGCRGPLSEMAKAGPHWGQTRLTSETAKADPPMWGQMVTDTSAGPWVLRERSANACV